MDLMRSAAIVDLPLPEDPTTATTLPGGKVRLKFFNIIYDNFFFVLITPIIYKYAMFKYFFFKYFYLLALVWSDKKM